MASGTRNNNAGRSKGRPNATKGKGKGASAVRAASAINKPKPWGAIIIAVALVAFAGGVFGYAYVQIRDSKQFTASEDNQDPSVNIPDVVRVSYATGQHVSADQRVAYDQSPPFGGPHDQAWASCEGMVYPTAVRNENMVHMLEHGAIWIAYNPDQVKGADLDKLKSRVTGQQFIAMSPYPGLDHPISLQSWGHQLKLDSADDPRIDEFIKALKRNEYQTPEPNADCNALGPGLFDPSNPPPFDPSPYPADAVKMDGTGASTTGMAGGQEAAPTEPATPSGAQTSAPATQPPAGG